MFLLRSAALFAVLALVLAGCGRSHSHSATSTAASAPTASTAVSAPGPTTATTGPTTHRTRQPHYVRHAHVKAQPVRLPRLPGPPPKRVPTPVPRQGDKSIQTYGSAPASSDFVAVASAVRTYDWAVAHDDGAVACAVMVSGFARPFAHQIQGTPTTSAAATCPKLLTAMFAQQPPQLRRQFLRVRVTDARLEGDHGFAIYTQPGFGRGFFPVHREGRTWKVAAISGSSLP